MTTMPTRIEQINEPKPARQSAASWIAEHIVLPCVVAFGAGVLVALHFIPAPAADSTIESTQPGSVRAVVPRMTLRP